MTRLAHILLALLALAWLRVCLAHDPATTLTQRRYDLHAYRAGMARGAAHQYDRTGDALPYLYPPSARAALWWLAELSEVRAQVAWAGLCLVGLAVLLWSCERLSERHWMLWLAAALPALRWAVVGAQVVPITSGLWALGLLLRSPVLVAVALAIKPEALAALLAVAVVDPAWRPRAVVAVGLFAVAQAPWGACVGAWARVATGVAGAPVVGMHALLPWVAVAAWMVGRQR